ncbi:MAG: hypothetical protein PHY73_03700 [Candidatus Omnitrophica bacterium]|nr:hypothetical protein [Candidatus Omnitrophota bacterium]
MKTIYLKLWMTLFACLVFGVQGVSAQDGKGDLIAGGTVVILGQRISPPYKIEIRNNETWINDILAEPLVNKRARVLPVVTDDIRKKHDFISRLTDDYLYFYKRFGREKFQKKLLEKYKKDSSASQLNFYKEDLEVIFKDGEKEFLMMGHSRSLIDRNISREEWARTVKEGNQNARRESIKMHERLLKRGGMLIYDYGSMSAMPPAIAQNIIAGLKNLKENSWSLEQTREELKRLGISDRVFEHIQENCASW